MLIGGITSATPCRNTASTPWRARLLGALQLEFEDYLDILDFKAEHRLTSEPLRIDVLIIRKDTETVIASPLASIFRKINIFEYKSPADKLTAGRFYKGLVYVLMYKLLNNRKAEKVDMSDISLKFDEADRGKRVYFCLRWETNTSLKGPWGEIYSAIIP
jgi:hypothetical protein